MKKLVCIGMVICSVASMQAVLPLMRQKASVFAKMFEQKMRSIAHISDVVRFDGMIEKQDRQWFALQGAAVLYNGTIAEALQTDATKKVASRLFNQHVGEPVRFTIAPGNPAIALNAQLISELIGLRKKDKISEKIFLESEFFKKWREAYPGNKKTFRQEVRRLIKELNELNDEKAAQLLAAALYYKSRADEQLLDCIKIAKLSIVDKKVLEKKELSFREKMLVMLIESRNSKDTAVLTPEEIIGFKNRCLEKSLWAIINLILYNYTERKLDLLILPQSMQALCSPALREFLEKHSDVHTPGYYEKAHKDFLLMVEGLSFIVYEGNYLHAPVFPNALQLAKLLQYLFGTNAKNCEEICKELQGNCSVRTITCKEYSEKKRIHFCVNYKDEPKKNLSGVFIYNNKHAFFAFDSQIMLSHKELLQIELLEKNENLKPGFYTKVANGYLHRICDWEKASPEDLKKIIVQYSLTLSDLTELSQGLGIHKDALIHTVVAAGNLKVLYSLLRIGCKTSLKNSRGYTPFHFCEDAYLAVEDKSKKESLELCSILLGAYHWKEVVGDFFSKIKRVVIENFRRE